MPPPPLKPGWLVPGWRSLNFHLPASTPVQTPESARLITQQRCCTSQSVLGPPCAFIVLMVVTQRREGSRQRHRPPRPATLPQKEVSSWVSSVSGKARRTQSPRLRLDLPSNCHIGRGQCQWSPRSRGVWQRHSTHHAGCSHFTPNVTAPPESPLGRKVRTVTRRAKGLHAGQEKGGRRQRDPDSF